MTYEETAIQVIMESVKNNDHPCYYIWLGDLNVWHDVFFKKNGHNDRHPYNQWLAVSAALRRSKKFTRNSRILSIGFFTERESWHTVFELKQEFRK